MRPRSEERSVPSRLRSWSHVGVCVSASVSTFILVSVQQVLELGVEDLQMLLYKDLLALPGQLVLSGFVEVNLHTPLLLQ